MIFMTSYHTLLTIDKYRVAWDVILIISFPTTRAMRILIPSWQTSYKMCKNISFTLSFFFFKKLSSHALCVQISSIDENS